MKHIYLFITLINLLTTAVTAQVTLIAPTKTVRSGDSVVIQLRVKARDTLSTMQFSLSWDPSVLSFGRLDTIGGFPPSAEPNEYGVSAITQGKMSFVWISTSLTGLPVVDTFDVFKIVFKAIGASGSISPLQYVGSPTSIRASNASLLTIPITSQGGSINIMGTNKTQDLDAGKGLFLEQNTPNPFHSQTVIPFTLTESSDVTLSVFDFRGQKLIEKKEFYFAGEQKITLDTEGILSGGSYVYTIRTKSGQMSRVFLKN